MEFNIFGKEISKKKKALAIVILVIAIGAAGFLISRNAASQIVIDRQPESTVNEKTATPNSNESLHSPKPEAVEVKKEEIKVYVTGCVKSSGIVILKKGQIIDDALKAAGGVTEDADLENINLAYKLSDSMMIKIKSKNEKQPVSNPGEAGAGIEVIKDSGGAVVNDATISSAPGGKLNINTASIEQLDTLPGIGAATAKDVIAYREKNGEFKAITDIMKITGIKESKFNKIKDLITVE